MTTPTTLQCAFRDCLRRLSATCMTEVNLDESGKRTAELIDMDQSCFDALVQEVNCYRAQLLATQQQDELDSMLSEADLLFDLKRGK